MNVNDLLDAIRDMMRSLDSDHGLVRAPDKIVNYDARTSASSLYPAQLFCEWLNRSPEAKSELLTALIRVEMASPNSSPEISAKTSESKIDGGIKGASAPPVVVNIGNAAQMFGRSEFRTREVKPSDIAGLGGDPVHIGVKAILGAAGVPLQATARFKEGDRTVEFLNRRGRILLMRSCEGESKGMIVNGPIELIEPQMRDTVMNTLAHLPNADDEFNFDPFEGMADPWKESSEKIASPPSDHG